MTTSVPPESTFDRQYQCYCLNPACQHPENQSNALVCQSCNSDLLLQRRFRAIKPIGQGGFGKTFLAVDESQQSHPYCVIKQFLPQHQGINNTEKAAELFHQEASRLESLGKHPQIPKLLSCFEQEQRQYLVQEFINGRNLAQELAQAGAFNETEIRQLLNQLLPVLQFVHNAAVIHRDIKPENIIRRNSNRTLALVDFGAAKYTTETTLTRTGTIIGSAAYAAPEQVRGKAVFASDIYSLGVTCIHLLTQVSPFDLFDGSEDTWTWRHYLNPKTPVSNQLGQVLDKMLQSATKQRYQSTAEVLKDLNTPAPAKSKKPSLIVAAFMLLGLVGGFYLNLQTQQQNQIVVSEFQQRRQRLQEAYSTQAGLKVLSPDKQQQVFPLQHTEVMAKIAGNVSRVEVTQSFSNPFNKPLEAVYVFPLPDEAAVDDMEIKIGDRIIRGLIKKRAEAQKIYQQAKQEGKTAGLLEQERDNIFTQSLANIKPGEKIDVTIRYTESLKFAAGNYEFVFPMVVAPRYIPGNAVDSQGNTNRVNDAARITPPTLPAKTRSGQDIGVTVEIEAGVPVQSVYSTSHQIHTSQDGRILRVQLDNKDTIPNKDLILRYQVAGKQTESTILAQSDERGGHFATYLIPAVAYQSNEIVPKDVVFLIDTSGSQAGAPMEESKALMRRFVNGLNANDTFTIIDFADTATALSTQPLQNTAENREKAIAYINRLDADGGTELLNGIETVLNFPPAETGRLRSVVLLTDGLIGDDNAVIAKVQSKLKPGNRLYSFGVGSSVNRFLIDRLAEVGRGTSQIVRQDEPTDKVVEKFFQQINNPVLTNIEVKWEGSGKAPEIYPFKSPDLFANQPLVLFGRKSDRSSGNLRITGIAAGGKSYEKTIPVEFEGGGNAAIAQLWGRAKIKDLMDRMFKAETSVGVKQVTDTAIAYRLLSKYTAFVAFSQDVRVNPHDRKLRQQVPVLTPEGMLPQKPSASSTAITVPEPSQLLGNSLAIVLLGIFFAYKRLKGLNASRGTGEN
ncbi:MAG TPA: serine/threonine protein kinase [Cyanobacteria bacterium UBA11049]|nr:serine/threonine protein kinase [Cyanobacteria bacterium UBA11049]